MNVTELHGFTNKHNRAGRYDPFNVSACPWRRDNYVFWVPYLSYL